MYPESECYLFIWLSELLQSSTWSGCL